MPATVTRILGPKDWTERQINNLKQTGKQNYDVGISKPKKDPIKAGIDAQGRYNQKMLDEEVRERRKTALQASSMDEWFKYASEIGSNRLVDGVTKREAEVNKFVSAWQPILESHVADIDAMPKETDTDMEERMLANLRGLKSKKGAWRS